MSQNFITFESLYNKFCKLYCRFKEDFKKVPRIELSEFYFYNSYTEDDECMELCLWLDTLKPRSAPDYIAKTQRRCINLKMGYNKKIDEYYSYFYNECPERPYYREDVLADELIKTYVELCSKYKELFKLYDLMKDGKLSCNKEDAYYIELYGDIFGQISNLRLSLSGDYNNNHKNREEDIYKLTKSKDFYCGSEDTVVIIKILPEYQMCSTFAYIKISKDF